MSFGRIERRVEGIRVPLAITLQVGLVLAIGVLLVSSVIGPRAIAPIRKQANDPHRIEGTVHAILGLNHSIGLM